MNIDLQLKQTQRQVLGQLQSLTVLQIPLPELIQYVEAALLENPLLERIEMQEVSDADDMPYSGRVGGGLDVSRDESAYSMQSLSTYLVEQLYLLGLSRTQFERLCELISDLDTRGYLTQTEETYARLLCTSQETVRADISILQSLEPAGVGARNLSECLRIQLERRGLTDTLAYTLVESYLQGVAGGQWERLAQDLCADTEAVLTAVKLIRSLNPKPGNGFDDGEQTRYIVPDVTVAFDGLRFLCRCEQARRLNLRLNREYLGMLGSTEAESELRAYLSEKLREGKAIIRAVSRRQETLLTCVNAILTRQHAFFMQGHLMPLTMSEIAADANLHVSTVSRALAGKYLSCDRGVYPFSYFFVKPVGENSHAAAVQERIRALILAEDKQKPLSDRAIAGLLQASGMDVSRRTVTKYREYLLLPPTTGRRQM